MRYPVDIVHSSELSEAHWSFMHRGGIKICYDLTISRDAREGVADWTLFLSDRGQLKDYMGVTPLPAIIDGRASTLIAIGGQLIPQDAEKERAYFLLEAAETFITERWPKNSGFLYCLPPMIPFFEVHGWIGLRHPVTIEGKQGPHVFPASAMTYKGPATRESKIQIKQPL